jgi:hypothetical protein
MNRLLDNFLIIFRFYFLPRHWQESWVKIVNRALWFLGTAWLLISLIQFFFKKLSAIPQTPNFFWFIFVSSLLIAIFSTIPPINIAERIQDKDILIRILIGNIFNQSGDIVVPSNSTFDTTFQNDFISPNSIQGQLAKREYDKVEYLDQEIERQLHDISPILTHTRTASKNKQYEIGTIIKLTHRSKFKSYWMALANVNEHGKPDGKFENLQICLESLWRYIGEKGHMTRLIMPVLGSGKTGINENRFTILKEIIFSFVAFSKELKITEELVICVHPSDITNETINMYELIKYLNYQCQYRYESNNNRTTSKEMS